MHYLTHRKLLDCSGRKVWGVFGDGEMDEPESMSALTLAVTVFSVTSWSELAREAQACSQRTFAGEQGESTPFIASMLRGSAGPIIAATDYVRAVPESVRSFRMAANSSPWEPMALGAVIHAPRCVLSLASMLPASSRQPSRC